MKRIVELDYLRCIAILGVIAIHISLYGVFNLNIYYKLFYILTLNNIITYEKICHFKSKIIDDEVGKLMSVKHNDNQRFIEMFEKGKLYELWSKFKHITIPNKEEWREIVKDKI